MYWYLARVHLPERMTDDCLLDWEGRVGIAKEDDDDDP